MSKKLNTARTLIDGVASSLRLLQSKSGLFARTYCLEAVLSDATLALDSAIELMDAENIQPSAMENIDASSCCCKCCHRIHRQEAEEQRRMAKIGQQLGENLIVIYDYFDEVKSNPRYKAIPLKVAQAVSNMAKLSLQLDK